MRKIHLSFSERKENSSRGLCFYLFKLSKLKGMIPKLVSKALPCPTVTWEQTWHCQRSSRSLFIFHGITCSHHARQILQKRGDPLFPHSNTFGHALVSNTLKSLKKMTFLSHRLRSRGSQSTALKWLLSNDVGFQMSHI